MTTQCLLIFPGGMQQSLDYAARAHPEYDKVIGASSVPNDPSRSSYPHWDSLPFVNDPDFVPRLSQFLIRHKVTHIFSPHPVIWGRLRELVELQELEVTLVNSAPSDVELHSYRRAVTQAREALESSLEVPGARRSEPALLQLASVYHQVAVIPGMCDYEKLLGLYSIFLRSPEGDVVEIGSWWGKSAYFLGRLAEAFGVGKLLCIDPWTDAGIITADADKSVAAAYMQFSAEEAFRVFLMNMLTCSRGRLNYLRQPAELALQTYRSAHAVTSDEFGSTQYQGEIAVLHIDGNHALDAVRRDIRDWVPLLVDGGWVVLDDYQWAFGAGPRVASDELLHNLGSRAECAFALGGALFIKVLRNPA